MPIKIVAYVLPAAYALSVLSALVFGSWPLVSVVALTAAIWAHKTHLETRIELAADFKELKAKVARLSNKVGLSD